MSVQGQLTQKAVHPYVPATTEPENKTATVATLRAELNFCFMSFNTHQRANAVLVLWGADETEDTRSFNEQIKQLIFALAGDDPHHSGRFALALEFTFHHIDDIGLQEDKRHQLNNTMNSVGRDYESTATEVRAIVAESLKACENSAPQEAVDSTHIADLSELPFAKAVPMPASMEPLLTDCQPVSAAETPEKPSVTRSVASSEREKKRKKPLLEPVVQLDTELPFVESEGKVGIRRSVKSRLSSMASSVQDAFSATRDRLSVAGKKLRSSASDAAESVKHNVSVWASKGAVIAKKALTSVRTTLSRKMTEAGITARDELRNTFNGKSVARLKSSAGRIAEVSGDVAEASATKVAKGLSKAAHAIGKAAIASGRKIQVAASVVAQGVAHVARAGGALVVKGAARIGNRWSALRGFERV